MSTEHRQEKENTASKTYVILLNFSVSNLSLSSHFVPYIGMNRVNAIEEMVSMIHLQRHYELQVKMMKKADTLDMRGNMLLRII